MICTYDELCNDRGVKVIGIGSEGGLIANTISLCELPYIESIAVNTDQCMNALSDKLTRIAIPDNIEDVFLDEYHTTAMSIKDDIPRETANGKLIILVADLFETKAAGISVALAEILAECKIPVIFFAAVSDDSEDAETALSRLKEVCKNVAVFRDVYEDTEYDILISSLESALIRMLQFDGVINIDLEDILNFFGGTSEYLISYAEVDEENIKDDISAQLFDISDAKKVLMLANCSVESPLEAVSALQTEVHGLTDNAKMLFGLDMWEVLNRKMLVTIFSDINR